MKGIDISSYQEIPDFNAVKNDGVELVVIKASQGTGYRNPYLKRQYDGAKANGLKIGFYHYLDDGNPEDEAEYFLNSIEGLDYDCKLVIDAEKDLGGVDETSSRTRRFADYLISKGKEVCLYTGSYFYNHSLNDSVKDLPLWVAQYSGSVPNISVPYIGWQYSETGRVNGINGDVDLNEFNEGILKEEDEMEYPIIDGFSNYNYLRNYPDLREAFDSGKIKSLTKHYIDYGQSEQRVYQRTLPEGFDLTAYKNLNEDLKNLDIDLVQHWLLYGWNETHRPYKYDETPQTETRELSAEELETMKNNITKLLNDSVNTYFKEFK